MKQPQKCPKDELSSIDDRAAPSRGQVMPYLNIGLGMEIEMSKDGIKGATQKGVGAMKEAAGKATGNKKLEAKGVSDRAAGSAKEVVGKTKDAIRKATR